MIVRLEFHLPAGTRTEPGRCAGCGCVDERACLEGCAWVDASHLLCTACVARALDAMQGLRATARRDFDKDGEFIALAVDLKPKRKPARRRRR